MTREQVEELARQQAQAVYNENETKYGTFDQVPTWARADVEEVYERLGLKGMGGSNIGRTRINASQTYIRVMYVIDKLLEMLDRQEGASEAAVMGSQIPERSEE